MRWFGESWNSPINDELERTDTPVGFPCEWCSEPIDEEDRGVVSGGYIFHLECHLRQVIGGLNHLRGRCTCQGGTEPPDPPDLTPREAAIAAAAEFRLMRHAE